MTESFSAHRQEMFPVMRDPVTVKLKRGSVLRANLIGTDANTIIIEVTGEVLKIDLEEVESIVQEARQFDEFYDVASDDEKARLDNFAIQLQNEPGTLGYIIVYGSRGARPGQAKKRADRDKGYLIEERGIDPGRLVSLDHCFRAKLTVQLWIVPSNAAPPKPC